MKADIFGVCITLIIASRTITVLVVVHKTHILDEWKEWMNEYTLHFKKGG